MCKYVRVCKKCGKVFETDQPKRLGCLTCNPVPNRTPIEKVCPCCGKLYTTVSKKQKACSKACQYALNRANLRADDLDSRLDAAIQTHGRPSSINELCRLAKCDYDTLKRRGITFNSVLLRNGLAIEKSVTIANERVASALRDIFGLTDLVMEKTFPGLKRKISLRVDMYSPSVNTCFEVDDQSHYNADAKHRDAIKDEFCKSNNICMVRIRYDSDRDVQACIRTLKDQLEAKPAPYWVRFCNGILHDL